MPPETESDGNRGYQHGQRPDNSPEAQLRTLRIQERPKDDGQNELSQPHRFAHNASDLG